MGLARPVKLPSIYHNTGKITPFTTEPSLLVATDGKGNDAIALRKFGQGLVVGFHFACYDVQNDPVVQAIYRNAANLNP